MINRDNLILAGKLQRCHGLDGNISFSSIYPLIEIKGESKFIFIEYDNYFVPYRIEELLADKSGKTGRIKLKGIESEKEASEFINLNFYLDSVPDEDLIISEAALLKGFRIIDLTSGIKTVVSDYIDNKVNPLLVVETVEGEEFYIPFNEELIVKFSAKNKKIEMKLAEGYFESLKQ